MFVLSLQIKISSHLDKISSHRHEISSHLDKILSKRHEILSHGDKILSHGDETWGLVFDFSSLRTKIPTFSKQRF